ncbi:MAG: DUF5676 family membrane protein [Acidobacteriota bacterium]
MKLDAGRFALAAALVTAITFTICAALVWLSPDPMMIVTGSMVHANLTGMRWTLTPGNYLTGLLAWTIVSGLIAWFWGGLYNRLLRS